MHDIKAIRENPEAYVAGWSSRGVDDAADVVARILALDVDLRAAQTKGQEALAKRNAASKAIGALMREKKIEEANLLRAQPKAGRPALYFLLLLITWVLGLVNAFEHAKDAWAVMPSGLILSVIVALLGSASAWIGLTNLRSGGAR